MPDAPADTSTGRPVVLLIGGDLMARDRLDRAAAAAGYELRVVDPARAAEAARAGSVAVVVVDLDAGRDTALDAVRAARHEGLVPGPVYGYFSHVDEALGARARDAGCTALPRGRFWRELPELLQEV